MYCIVISFAIFTENNNQQNINMKKQIIILSLLIASLSYGQEDKTTKHPEEKQIKEVVIKKTKKAIEKRRPHNF